MIVLDTSVAYAILDGADRRHRQAARWYERVDDDLITTPLVLAELDHLAVSRAGAAAAGALRRDVIAGAYVFEWWDGAAAAAAEIAEAHADLGLSLTDASLVALADRLRTTDVATFDERHFRVVRPVSGAGAFRLLPIDV